MIPKIVLIGAGRFGENHLRTLKKLDSKKIIKFVGVVDLDPKIRKKVKTQFLINTSDKLEDFIEQADGFDVVTPPDSHYKLVKFLLKKNKHVFVEKPLTLKSKQSEELLLIAKKNKKILQVGHIFRYNETINHLKKLVKKNNEPYYIIGNFLQDRVQGHNTGAIFIFMHGFDILDNLINSNPTNITGIANLYSEKTKQEINSYVLLKYKKLSAFVNVGYIPVGKRRSIEIFSKNSHIICDLLEQQIIINKKNKPSKKIVVKQKNEPLILELKDFAKSIKNHSNPIADGKVGTRIVKICELATQSIKSGKSFSFSKRLDSSSS